MYQARISRIRLARPEWSYGRPTDDYHSARVRKLESGRIGAEANMKLTMQQVKFFETLQKLDRFDLSWYLGYGTDKRRGWTISIDGVSLPDFHPTVDGAFEAIQEYLRENNE